ncbi:HEAT repeat associated with sister chromatid cohesion family protein [Lyngbya aestuarii BL J]|uniref:HEAT repeat associated with sister chromatid cohesion family protein n=1 Tax=Lyngbya aestuarii BL J TaxID=1348334 RepID=U7QMD7_9CYAN|nr:HEAT repeat domain-containing protein [Lyngbya aestuarii]ERT08280.1 HEAT repeat associated with sister chromatid cohesion family protein [Lyngbya aestuarii BL J]
MEPITTVAGWVVPKVGDLLWKGATEQVKKTLNKTDIEKAIASGLKVAEDWEKKQNLAQKGLFYRVSPDGINGVSKFLERVLADSGVQAELQKPLSQKGQPDIAFLAKVFEQEATTSKIPLNSSDILPWIEQFVKAYFEKTSTYLKFQVAKENYFKQLENWFDDVKFAGISVPGQEVDQSEKLAQIFVMPDVVEDISTQKNLGEWLISGSRQAELIQEQRERVLFENSSGRKLLASELLTEFSSKKAVLLGAPGSGKTTLVSYFAVMLAQNRPELLGLDVNVDWLPILIRMRDFSQHPNLGILDFAKQFAEKRMSVKTLSPGFFEYWLEDGRTLILLDGLDEIADESKRSDIVRRIENFLGQYDKNIAIITSRPAGYRRDFFRTEEFPHYELKRFDDEKIEQFINNWYESRFKDQTEAERRKDSLRKALDGNDRIKLLARNPLLLTIIALIHRYQAVLPKERYKLYQRAVDTLLTSWDANKELSNHTVLNYLELDDLQRLMEGLAFWIHTQGNTGDNEGGTVIDREELIEQLSREIKTLKQIERYQAKQEAERFIEFIRDRTGLLNEQGQDCYAFVHKTFQEYLCAQDVNYQADNEDDFEIVLNAIKDCLHDAHWREVLLLLISQQKPKKAAKAIRAILNRGSEYEQWLHRDLLFAGCCLAEYPKGLKVADGGLVEDVLERLVGLEIKHEKLVGNRVSEQVFKILCSLYETEFETQALQLLKEHSDQIDEYRLQKYQVELGEREEVIQTLLQQLTDEDSDVRATAAEILGELGNRSEIVVDALLLRLTDENYNMCWKAANAVSKLGIGSQTLVDTLLQRLSDENSDVRGWAAYALGILGNSSQTVLDALLQTLSDEVSDMRGSAAIALGELGNSSQMVVDALLKTLSDEASDVRRSAAFALGFLGKGSQTVVDALLQTLSDEDSFVRGSAAIALGELGNSSQMVVDALLKTLSDEASDVRRSAAIALGELGNSSQMVINALLQTLTDEDSHVREWAAYALGDLGDSSQTVVDALLQKLSDEDSDVRGGAASALGQLGNSSQTVVDALLKTLTDEDSYPRRSAASALGELGKKSDAVFPAVIDWLEQHQDSESIGSGIDALWNLLSE